MHEINALSEDERYIAVTSQVDNTYTIIDVEKMEIFKIIKLLKYRIPVKEHLILNMDYGMQIQ